MHEDNCICNLLRRKSAAPPCKYTHMSPISQIRLACAELFRENLLKSNRSLQLTESPSNRKNICVHTTAKARTVPNCTAMPSKEQFLLKSNQSLKLAIDRSTNHGGSHRICRVQAEEEAKTLVRKVALVQMKIQKRHPDYTSRRCGCDYNITTTTELKDLASCTTSIIRTCIAPSLPPPMDLSKEASESH